MDALIYTGQKYLSENNALYEIIDYYRKHDPLSTNIYLIDRGLIVLTILISSKIIMSSSYAELT